MISRLFPSASPLEKRACFAIIALQALVITLPYLWAVAIAPDGFGFGGLLYNPDDQNVHLSWARQAAEGRFFFRDLFTTETLGSGERPLFTNLLCWLMGVLHAVTRVPLIGIYHGLRVACAILVLLLFYRLSTLLTADRRVRIIALALAAFSSGAGYLAPLFPGRIWIDRPDATNFPMMPEAFTFASAFIFTLNIASLALLLLIYVCVLRAHETGSRQAALAAGASTLLLGNIHTYDVFPLVLALTAWTLLAARSTPKEPRTKWLSLGCVLAGAAIPVFYQWLVFRGSAEFRLKALTPTPAPPLLDVLLSYGPLLLLAVAGGVLAWRDVKIRLLVCWALATLICIYAPVSFARKMIEGLHLPLCLLAAIAVVALLSRLPSRPLRGALALGVLALLSISSWQFVIFCIGDAQNRAPARAALPPAYLPASDWAAMEFLKTQPKDKAVLCLPFTGNYVPRETGMTTYVGHWAETLDFTAKLNRTLQFYAGKMPPDQAQQWLRENRIGYILIGPHEIQLGGKLSVDVDEKIFDASNTVIYAAP